MERKDDVGDGILGGGLCQERSLFNGSRSNLGVS